MINRHQPARSPIRNTLRVGFPGLIVGLLKFHTPFFSFLALFLSFVLNLVIIPKLAFKNAIAQIKKIKTDRDQNGKIKARNVFNAALHIMATLAALAIVVTLILTVTLAPFIFIGSIIALPLFLTINYGLTAVYHLGQTIYNAINYLRSDSKQEKDFYAQKAKSHGMLGLANGILSAAFWVGMFVPFGFAAFIVGSVIGVVASLYKIMRGNPENIPNTRSAPSLPETTATSSMDRTPTNTQNIPGMLQRSNPSSAPTQNADVPSTTENQRGNNLNPNLTIPNTPAPAEPASPPDIKASIIPLYPKITAPTAELTSSNTTAAPTARIYPTLPKTTAATILQNNRGSR